MHRHVQTPHPHTHTTCTHTHTAHTQLLQTERARSILTKPDLQDEWQAAFGLWAGGNTEPLQLCVEEEKRLRGDLICLETPPPPPEVTWKPVLLQAAPNTSRFAPAGHVPSAKQKLGCTEDTCLILSHTLPRVMTCTGPPDGQWETSGLPVAA